MLYDKRWDIKADPYSLESVIAWLETHPPSKRYEFANCDGECLFSQYLRKVDSSHRFGDGSYARLCVRVPQSIAGERPRTFGAALERARAALIAVD